MTGTTAPQVDFYESGGRQADEPLALVVALAARFASGETPVSLLARDDTQADRLDAGLWAVGEAIFVPHAVADDPVAGAAWVLIVAPAHAAPLRPVIINLRHDPVPFDAQRIIELIPTDEDGKVAARERWRHYQSRGLKPVKRVFDAG